MAPFGIRIARRLAEAFTGTLFPLRGGDSAVREHPVKTRARNARPPRDSQRSKLYEAERALRGGRRFDSVPECQAYVDGVLASAYWRARFPRVRAIRVTDGRGRRHAGAFVESGRIALPKWARSERVLLHEIAHHAAPHDAAAHGPEYARIYVELVREFWGDSPARKLTAAFDVHGVKISGEDPRARQRTMILRESPSPAPAAWSVAK